MARRRWKLDSYLDVRVLVRILFPEVQLLDHIREAGLFNGEALRRIVAGGRAAAVRGRPGGMPAPVIGPVGDVAGRIVGAVESAEATATRVVDAAAGAAASTAGAIQSALAHERPLQRRQVDAAFDWIEHEMAQYVLEQPDCIRDLCVAFKRPFVSGGRKSYRNLVFVCGPEGSGRHLAVSVMARLMRDRGLMSRTMTSRLDLAKYATEKAAEDLFVPDLYKALYGPDAVVVLENPEKAHASALDKLVSLGVNGALKLDRRYVSQLGKMAEVTGALMLGTTDEIQCNGKYLVFITGVDASSLGNMFPRPFMENVLDTASTKPLSRRALSALAKSWLEDYAGEAVENLGLSLSWKDVEDWVVAHADPKRGAHGVRECIESFIEEPLVELQLRKVVPPGMSCRVLVKDDALYLRTPVGEHSLDAVRRRREEEAPEALDRELERIIGLDSVKAFINDLKHNLRAQKMREAQGERPPKMALHMIFTGNPGTGKTTMARLVARYLKALGYISSGHLVEVGRPDLVGQYVGETAQKTLSRVRSALGGVLFIDEAYSLARDKDDVYGIEAVDTLVKAMEDNRENLVVILAGYTAEMEEFLKTNPGLRSRFNYTVEFPDYTPEEMLKILGVLARAAGYSIEPGCEEPLLEMFERLQIPGRNDSGNGRLVRNLLERAIAAHSRRIATAGAGGGVAEAELNALTPADFGLKESSEYDLDAELSRIVGLAKVKDFLRDLEKQLLADQKRRKAGLKVETGQSLHMIFTGNAGTGKTTVARLVAKMMREMGALKSGRLVETGRSGLVAEYAGQTAGKTTGVFLSALGGVLFIDEAYTLASDGPTGFGREAIDTLVKLMEDHRENIVVILAGYEKEMDEFLATNPGLQSRFPIRIDFPDYSAEELVEIVRVMAGERGFRIAPGAVEALRDRMGFERRRGGPSGGNARLARNVLEEAIRRQSARIAVADGVAAGEMIVLEEADFAPVRETPAGFDLEERLSGVVGLGEVKDFVRSLQAQLRVQNERKRLGMEAGGPQTLHMIFKGNPGTGKTMMARIVGGILHEMGVLSGTNFVETDRGGLVAGYVGQTALKTKEVVRRALDGILFIDEAYSLAQEAGSGADFGREAIDTLVKEMDDNRDRLVVILAGYSAEMDAFLDTNPGLKSRFPTVIEFPDYSTAELEQIAARMFASAGFRLTEGASARIREILEAARQESHFGNGRYVRNLFEKAVRNQAVRLQREARFDRDSLETIEDADIQAA
ncbi:MAG: AAA family ATPase [Firmicutes bacterium]|nr:AAA family ATPase [Bacillota bacterium]